MAHNKFVAIHVLNNYKSKRPYIHTCYLLNVKTNGVRPRSTFHKEFTAAWGAQTSDSPTQTSAINHTRPTAARADYGKKVYENVVVENSNTDICYQSTKYYGNTAMKCAWFYLCRYHDVSIVTCSYVVDMSNSWERLIDRCGIDIANPLNHLNKLCIHIQRDNLLRGTT